MIPWDRAFLRGLRMPFRHSGMAGSRGVEPHARRRDLYSKQAPARPDLLPNTVYQLVELHP